MDSVPFQLPPPPKGNNDKFGFNETMGVFWGFGKQKYRCKFYEGDDISE
jgi:hypothetical protein